MNGFFFDRCQPFEAIRFDQFGQIKLGPFCGLSFGWLGMTVRKLIFAATTSLENLWRV
jgi:crotonobetainyl-CoA:carnitine CoA-transferase CaiB-like acyl-CoA transferase